MYKKAYINLLNNITEVYSLEELKTVVDKGGYAKMMWDGDVECENKIKEVTNATSRCMPFDQIPFDKKCAICGKPAKYVIYFAKAY
jgi:prolyl-tRNA synthetase